MFFQKRNATRSRRLSSWKWVVFALVIALGPFSVASDLSAHRGTNSIVALATDSETVIEWELALLFFDPYGVLGDSQPAFERELRRLLATARVSVRLLDTKHPAEELKRAKSPTFRAILFPTEADRMNLNPAVMGVTVGSGKKDRAVFVFYPAVVRTLRLDDKPDIVRSRAGSDLCARAVARVLAHELVHAAAPELDHADEGLLKARILRSTLTRPDLSLDETSAAALRIGIERRVETYSVDSK